MNVDLVKEYCQESGLVWNELSLQDIYAVEKSFGYQMFEIRKLFLNLVVTLGQPKIALPLIIGSVVYWSIYFFFFRSIF